jgi:hypothetical protein
MSSEQSQEDGKENSSSNSEQSAKQDKTLDTQNQAYDDDENESSLIADMLPPEVLEGLPPEEEKRVRSSLSILAMMQGGARQSSPLAKQLKSEHITQIIENSEKESQREFEKSRISENTKRLGMGSILSLVVVVFVYAGITNDKDLSEKVVLAGISAIRGFGAGYAVAKEKK